MGLRTTMLLLSCAALLVAGCGGSDSSSSGSVSGEIQPTPLPKYDFSAVDARFQQFLNDNARFDGISVILVDKVQGVIHEAAFGDHNLDTIVLLALYLALPRPFSRRQLERLFMGWCILYLSQTMNLLFHVKCLYALSLGEWSLQNYTDFSRDFYGFWRYFTDLPGRFSFPFLIWLGFNWDFVIQLLGPVASVDDDPSRKNKA